MNLNRLIITVCGMALLLLAVTTVQAATTDERAVVCLTLTDGLAGETVHSVMTDHNGSTLITTSNGVTLYNGKHLLNFRILDEEGMSLAVYDLCETRRHSIYAATENGLYCKPHGVSRFERVLTDRIGKVNSLLAVGDTVFIGSQQGIMYYDGTQLYRQNVSPSHKGLDNIVRQYAQSDDGRIWFLGRYDLNSFDPKTKKTERYSISYDGQPLSLSQFAPVGDGLFVIGSRTMGLFAFDIQTKQLQRIEGVGNIISTVQRAADGSICVATDGAGAYRLEIRDNRLEIKERFDMDGDGRHRLPSNGTYCYYRDQHGVNWFGMVRYGLAYTYHSGRLFQIADLGDFTTEGMNVRTYCRHDQHAIVGTQNGFYYANTETGQNRYYSSQDLGGGHIVNTVAWYEGRFYIGTFDGGLRVFDPQTQQLSRQTFLPQLDASSIGDLKSGPDGRLWIGCSDGLIIVGEGRVQQHFTEQNSHIVSGLILGIIFDHSGNAWLTGGAGCSLYSVRSRGIVDTNFPKGFFNRHAWMRGATGHDGLIFMRTGPQTFYTNEQMTDFGELKFPVTFYDKWCRSFVDDMNGHYLLATERGVFCFDYTLQSMQHFGYGEGLRGSLINDMSLTSDGNLWVATSQGLFYTNLETVAAWQKDSAYQVRLFNIRRGSDLLNHTEGYEANSRHHIRLKWNLTSDVLQAEPMLMDYAQQTGRLYEYQVDGNSWQLADDGQAIYVKGLELGHHRLEVRLAGAAGTASVYDITVVPSGWATFELILLLVAIALLWLWWRFRKTTKVLLSERDEIEDALVEAMDELEASKYERVKIDEQECAAIVSRMTEYIERERVFTNADLKMKDLADVLHLSAPKLSQVFNLYLGQNYYDFINGYRLQEFKRLIEAGEYKRYTITALSEQCGFKKSNFFSTFRKVEGLTPAEYLKKRGIKV